MKRKILIWMLILVFSFQFTGVVWAEETGAVEYSEDQGEYVEEYSEEAVEPRLSVVDNSSVVEPGGDKIHIIKVFEQRGVCDAILIESDGHFGMVDVGLPYDYQNIKAHDVDNSVVNYLKNYGVEKLDFILLTHMHVDHVGNFENILRTFPVDTVYVRTFDLPDYIKNNTRAGNVSELCDTYKVKKAEVKDGQEIPFWNLTMKIFNLDDKYHATYEDGGENNNCIALLVTDSYGHKAFLAADMNNYDGDEDRLVELHYDELKDVDYFKVGHHGASGSSTYDFLQMLNPLYITVTGWRIYDEEDPFRPGHMLIENFEQTRGYKEGSLYYMFESENGIIFNMGETLSINNTFTHPSHTGDANRTLSIYYNANGGKISEEKETEYALDDEGNIYNAIGDSKVEVDFVEQRALEGDVAPVYYYDMSCTLENAASFGLVKEGYTFTGKWENKDDKEQKFDSKIRYGVLDIAPKLAKDSCEITLLAKWRPNKYSLIFHANGGSGSMQTMYCQYDKEAALSHNSFEREGYIFKGWNTKPDGSGKAFSNEQIIKNITNKDNKMITLYAQWEKISRDKREYSNI